LDLLVSMVLIMLGWFLSRVEEVSRTARGTGDDDGFGCHVYLQRLLVTMQQNKRGHTRVVWRNQHCIFLGDEKNQLMGVVKREETEQ
jgi:hypothetical protein